MNTHPPAPHALLFDLDGTLVDSLRDIADAWNTVLTAEGFDPHPVEAYRHFVGDGMAMLVRRAHPKGESLSDREIHTRVRAMREAYAGKWKQHTVPYEGIRTLLEVMQRHAVPMGVLSNKPEHFTTEMVDHLFPEVPWNTVRGAREGVPVKPAPDAGREVLCDWDLSPEQVWYIGDTCTDMQFATAVGFVPVGVTWGFRDREELIRTGAQILVDTPKALETEILEKINSGVPNRDPS